MAMKCERCGFINPDGSIFCDGCGQRIVVGVGDLYTDSRESSVVRDSQPVYIVWRGLPFAIWETRVLTRFQFFLRLYWSMAVLFILLPAFWVIGFVHLWVIILLVTGFFWHFAWSEGRRAAERYRR